MVGLLPLASHHDQLQYIHHANGVKTGDITPSNYEEATEKKEWKDAMIEEYQSIMKNDVWDVVPRPEGKSVVTSKWIYKH